MNIKFSKPKNGEIRYLAFYAKHHNNEVILQKVKMNRIGRLWFGGKVLETISGPEEYADDDGSSGDYYYYCFLENESDAKKLLVYTILEDDDFFYRERPEFKR